jgi:hypothetical protein
MGKQSGTKNFWPAQSKFGEIWYSSASPFAEQVVLLALHPV